MILLFKFKNNFESWYNYCRSFKVHHQPDSDNQLFDENITNKKSL